MFKKVAEIIDITKFKPQEDQNTVDLPLKSTQVERSSILPIRSPKWENACSVHRIPRLYQDASLDNCDMLPDHIVDLGKRWAASNRKTSLYIFGNTGSGKTYFSTALFRYLVEKGHTWLYYKKSNILDCELLKGFEEGNEEYTINYFVEVPVLVIDDLGVERMSERTIRQYYGIIDGRVSEKKLTIITSNYMKKDLPLGDRIISRLETFFDIEFPRKDLRKDIGYF